jgi:ferric-dicitrate binding protein FerR (iron transport regulator)
MNNPVDWELLARCLADECTEEEKEKVAEWVNANPENRSMMKVLKAAWDTPEVPEQESDVKKLWQEVAARTKVGSQVKRSTFPGYNRLLKYAAVFLLLISLPFLFKLVKSSFFPSQSREWQEVTVNNGGKTELTLADGTQVTLDAGSRFRFPTAFNGNTRRVFLNGEGYFKVSPGKDKPFTVLANHGVITVKGTEFNIRAWQQARRVEVAVVEGSVSLHRENSPSSDAVLIFKGQLSVLREKGQPDKPRIVDIGKYLGWLQRDMEFADVPLQEILFQLERWYDVRFVPSEGISLTDRLTVHLKDGPLEDTLELIAALMGIKYKQEGRKIYLYTGEN